MFVRTTCILLTGAAILGAGPALAQGCPFDRDITVSEKIMVWKPGTPSPIVTIGRPFPSCNYAIVEYKGALPPACKEGATFTATGRLRRVASDPPGTYGVLEATRLSCQ